MRLGEKNPLIAVRRVTDRAPFPVVVGLGTVGSVLLVLVSGAIGSVPRPHAVTWFWRLRPPHYAVAHLAFYTGLTALSVAWLLLGAFARRGELGTRRAGVTLVLWATPLFLGVPLFGRDVYSYIAQGTLAHQGLNPYHVNPLALPHHSALFQSLAVVWRGTTSPYGPLWVLVTRITASLAGSSVVAGVLAFRVVALVSLFVVFVLVAPVAKHVGANEQVARWLVALSPLMLASALSSAHNDILMLAIVFVALWAWTKQQTWWAVALFALAASVKLPALAGVAFVLLAPERDRRRRLAMVLVGAALAILVISGVTWLNGDGWGWLSPTALKLPTLLRIITTPSVCVGVFVAAIAHLLGVSASTHTIVGYVQPVIEALGAFYVLTLLVGVRPTNALRRLGLALMVVVLTSPTVWPWYYLWGLSVLAVTGFQASVLLPVLAVGAMWTVGPGGTPMLGGNGYLVVAPLLVALTLQSWRSGRFRTWREGVDVRV